MVKRKIITLAVLLLVSLTGAMGQAIIDGYNPFVASNLDDPLKLQETPVVESSYHRYWVKGDMNYGDASTFVWYAENGAFGTYDTITKVWTPVPKSFIVGNGISISRAGAVVNGVNNSSEIWIKWDDGSAGKTGYVAVYEKSFDGCIENNQITGFKHTIVASPEVWFIVGNYEQCSDQEYQLTIKFNNVFPYSYPYTVKYTYPDNDGISKEGLLTVGNGDLDASLQYSFNLNPVKDLDVTKDETYKIVLNELTDKFGSTGRIAPLGAAKEQFDQITLTVFHLPQTGKMTMD